jgi:hypothetical protein
VSLLQPGGVVQLNVPLGNGGWLWKWRAADANGAVTPWNEFGSNPPPTPDVLVNVPSSGGGGGRKKKGCGLTGFEPVLLMLALVCRRRRCNVGRRP